MTGYLILTDGRELKLPNIHEWRICHTMGEPCDCFELSCPLDEDARTLVETAYRFRAEHNGETVFCGLPDEISFLLDKNGLTLNISGRGMAALLLDNQPGPVSFPAVTLGELVKTFVMPLGISCKLERAGDASALAYSIGASQNVWKIISGFSKAALGITPRFTKEGVMVLSTVTNSNKQLVINQASKAMLTLKRYGVISELYLNGYSSIFNDKALSRGISCRKVVSSAVGMQNALEEAENDYLTLTVTVPKAFAAFPDDWVLVSCGVFDGLYRVWESESTGDETGEFCALTLKKG